MARNMISTGKRVLVGNYGRRTLTMVRGKNEMLYDANQKAYLDLFAGFGACGLGHCPPRVVNAIRRQSSRLLHSPNTYYSQPQIELASAIRKAAGYAVQCFFCNGGTEATEAAMKLARLYHRGRKHKIIVAANSFHGRTMGALSATSQRKYQDGFRPLVPGFITVPFSNIDAVSKAIDSKTGAVMMEVIQGESGVNMPDNDFFPQLQALCKRKKILLICDEVWTGMGRTGKMFAHQLYKIKPDIFTLGKALGGGVPCAAMVAKSQVARSLIPGTHGSTLGGNCLTNAAGLAVFETIIKDKLLARTARLGRHIGDRLARLAEECRRVKEVRGIGLMYGIELRNAGDDVVETCMKQRVLVNCAQGNIIRLAPAMTISDRRLKQGLKVVCNAIAQ